MYTPFDIAIIVGAACGLIMVAGSIWLLRVGVIDLRERLADGEAINVAVREIKVSTRYPALALFVIGGFFVLGSAYLAKREVREIPISGRITAENDLYLADVELRLFATEGTIPVNQAGEARHVLLYAVEPRNLSAQIIAPGYADHERIVPLERKDDGSWTVTFSLSDVVAQKPTQHLKVD